VKDDITPDYLPIGLARDVLEKVPNAKAMVVVLVMDDENDTIWSDLCGTEKQWCLWALEEMKQTLLASE